MDGLLPAIRHIDREPEPYTGLAPASFTSLILHAALFVILGTIFTPTGKPPKEMIVSSAPKEEPVFDEINELQQFRFSRQEHPEIGSASAAGDEVVASVAPKFDQTIQMTQRDIPVEPGVFEMPLLAKSSLAPQLSQYVAIKGAAGVGAVGAVGAVDRITEEILLSIEQRPTVVAWIFDRSGSMYAQRATINQRFERVYQELGMSHLVKGVPKESKPLLTSVIAFGKDVNLLTPEPTDDLEQVQKLVAGIKNDSSGVEKTFGAVTLAAQRLQHYRTDHPQRNVMIVLFTDEVGDDEDRAEATAALCRRLAIRVYVVGVPAPFGRRNIEVRYVDPDPAFDQSEQWIPVRQGPETLMPEAVALGFIGHARRDDDLYRIDSGFGPYWLTRLAYETGGMYFTVHPNRPENGQTAAKGPTAIMSAWIEQFFDPNVMRAYVPDYVPPVMYQKLVADNKARQALVQAAQMASVMQMNNPTLEFYAVEGDESAIKRQLDEAQKAAAYLEPRIDAIYKTLKQGEPDRPKLTQPRWRAGYDLAMGRILAAKVRTEAYNLMLAKAKQGLKPQTPKANVFTIVAADEISVGSQHEKLARQAREYLERVVREHPNTPWGYVAAIELKEPIGWKWTDRYNPPPPPPPPMVAVNNGTPPPPAAPAPPPPPPKPKREVAL
jgi:hypothetical protein